jgi:hypothetical protein
MEFVLVCILHHLYTERPYFALAEQDYGIPRLSVAMVTVSSRYLGDSCAFIRPLLIYAHHTRFPE